MSQNTTITNFLPVLKANPSILDYARNVATALIDGPKNHCAGTLSALLVFMGIYPNGGGTGVGDFEPEVTKLAFDLEKKRGWSRVAVGDPIAGGYVGVVLASEDDHHIYLIIDTTDQANPVVADNQGTSFHSRPVAGDDIGHSPTAYFLVAPN